MRNLLLIPGMISLSTQVTKGANCFSRNWNRIGFCKYINIIFFSDKLSLNISSCSLPSIISSSLNLAHLSSDFIEWFRGFTDAEGCFLIAKFANSFAFRFIIKLHKDDIDLLHFIHKSLGGIGNITFQGSTASLKITSISEIKLIIEIFSTYSLNSNKYLNFLTFRKAYELYTFSNKRSNDILQEISKLKDSMNTKRINLEIPLCEDEQNKKFHKIRITDNWLLGFIEGDGSFSITKENFILTFSISQKGNLALMTAIKSYLGNLAFSNKFYTKYKTYGKKVIYLTKSKNTSGFNYVLIIKSKEFLDNILIPYLDSWNFYSKKRLDYTDWKYVSELKKLGLHYQFEGKMLIKLILSQMNNNRLSNSGSKLINRNHIDSEVIRLLKGPSNYKIIEGKIFIKSLNKFHSSRIKIQVELQDSEGLIFKTFDSMSQCAKFLKVSGDTVSKKMKGNIPILLNDKKYYIIKSFNDII